MSSVQIIYLALNDNRNHFKALYIVSLRHYTLMRKIYRLGRSMITGERKQNVDDKEWCVYKWTER